MTEAANPIDVLEEVSEHGKEHADVDMYFNEDYEAGQGGAEISISSSPNAEEQECSEEETETEAKEEEQEENKGSPSVVKTPHSEASTPYPILSPKELSDLKNKNPLEAFRRMVSMSSTESKPSASTASVGDISISPHDALIRDLRAHILEVDLFGAIEADHVLAFKIKDLLHKLNIPESTDSLIGFIVEFEPLLDQISKDIQKKKSIVENKERELDLLKTESAAVESAEGEISTLEHSIQATARCQEVADYDALISEYQKQIKELQSKIAMTEEKKANVLKTTLAPLEASLRSKATSAIEHLERVNEHDAALRKLNTDEKLINTRLAYARAAFERLKNTYVI